MRSSFCSVAGESVDHTSNSQNADMSATFMKEKSSKSFLERIFELNSNKNKFFEQKPALVQNQKSPKETFVCSSHKQL